MQELISHSIGHATQNGKMETAYHEIGEGYPFVLVHGFTGSKLDFHNQLPWFAEERRVLAIDQRGHGGSSNLAPYAFASLVDDFVSFLDAKEIERCDILGHSMGGMVAMRVAAQHGDRVRSLVLMDTSATPIQIADETTREHLADELRAEGCQVLLPMMQAADHPKPVQRGIDFLGTAEHWRRIKLKLTQMDPEAFVCFAEALSLYADYSAQLPNIACRTSVIVGAHDKAFIKPSTVLAKRIPNAELFTIADAAHSPQYENADQWRYVVHQHLQGVE